MLAPHLLRSLGLVLLVAGVAPTGAAFAQGSQAPPSATATAAPAIRDDVRKLHNDALLALKRNQLDAAYKGFLEAWALQKIPRIAGNLGRTELRLEKYRDAAEHIALFLREDQTLGQQERTDLEAQLARARAQVGVLRVEVAQAGAEVWVDGAAAGTAPLAHEIYLDPGKHTVEARHADSVAKKEIEARAGAEETVRLDATPPSPSAKAPSAPSVQSSAPSAAAGRPIVPALVVGGVGALGLIAGAVALGMYADKRNQAEALYSVIGPGGCRGTSPHPACPSLESIAREADVFRGAGPALLIGGAAVAAGATTYLLWPQRSAKRGTAGGSGAQLGAMASPEGASVSISGKF